MKEDTFKQLVMPSDLNPGGNLFGGALMAWMDKATALHAMEYTGENCVTFLVDQFKFEKAVKLGDCVKIETTISKVGNTSVSVVGEAFKKSIKAPASEYVRVCTSTFIYVALDDLGNKKEITRREI